MQRTQLITTADLTREEVDFFIKEAEALRGKKTDDLKGLTCASLFFEPSTRTRLSFESAALNLGASLITVANASSTSMKKGETLTDTIRVIEKYADILFMRHPKEGAAAEAIRETKKPFLNAGDGANQHPTQALLDMYTIQREMGTIDGLTIGFVGDMKFGRTVHSILYLLRHYKVKKIIFITPGQLKIPNNYLKMLEDAGIEYLEDSELNKYVPEMDILYMTRIQQERFENLEEYYFLKGSYILTSDVVRLGKPEMKVMHPLPRIDEITAEVDGMPNAAYYREAENGVYMRMALLKTLAKNYYK
ncbi:aspartate carbamoyltransferase [Patescibacteria group bacterium]|nr:aspartate carbamoyltransferase [Patescibacteria group bacterium]MBU1015880.1 aspartate carbamoyltransferase [Patescibacteria group bacterium]MBU1684749.1 aspartate carbamoyltransferase [Patescibacteria group bacterium]MBU1938885.1 aspartate carbamoyltransferase [Patescibacteria group bacterium]